MEILIEIEDKKRLQCLHCSLLCPEQDSNLHAFDGASPSSWCVYQFHHLGIVINILNYTSAFLVCEKVQTKTAQYEFSNHLPLAKSVPETGSNLHILANASP